MIYQTSIFDEIYNNKLPPLQPTCIVIDGVVSWTAIHWTGKQRSKSFDGISKAMAEQWG